MYAEGEGGSMLKLGQRIKWRGLRGTVLTVYMPVRRGQYQAIMDNGAFIMGTKHQLKPVMRRGKA